MPRTFIFFILVFLAINSIAQNIVFKDSFTKSNSTIIINEKEKSETMKASFSFNKSLIKELILSEVKNHLYQECIINYTLYLNKNQQIDSALITTSIMEYQKVDEKITRTESKIYYLTENQKIYLSVVFNKVLKNYAPKVLFLRSIAFGGAVMLSRINTFKTKNAGDYLASLDKNSKTIDLSGYGLKEIPEELRQFNNIETLNLSKNLFSGLNINPKNFKKLKTLNLSDNFLNENTLRIKRNRNIQVLNLSDNSFTKLKGKFLRNLRLRDLLLANNQIIAFENRTIRKIKTIEVLNLYNCYLNQLPSNINKLKNLSIFDLYHNNLKQLPESITELNQLQTLAISNNELWYLPSGISNLKNIKYLYAHHNKLDKIESLPPNLELLDLGYNLFVSLPPVIGQCKRLEHIDFSNNKINENIGILEDLPNLKFLYLVNNEWEKDQKKINEINLIFNRLLKKNVTIK